jgi:putative iron-dependent peroxidase
MFVAFGSSVDAFEAQLRRMVGLEDGVTDALFGMSRPVTGCHAWCPPMDGDALDLRVLLA